MLSARRSTVADAPRVVRCRVLAPVCAFSVQTDCTLALAPATIAHAAAGAMLFRGSVQQKGSV